MSLNKKFLPFIILILLIPSIASAVWWNPFTWFKSKKTEIEFVDKKIADDFLSDIKINNLPPSEKIFITDLATSTSRSPILIKEKSIIKNMQGYKIEIPVGWYVFYSGVNLSGTFALCSSPTVANIEFLSIMNSPESVIKDMIYNNKKNCSSYFSIGAMIDGAGLAPKEYETYEGAIESLKKRKDSYEKEESRNVVGINYTVEELIDLIPRAKVIKEELNYAPYGAEVRQTKYYIYFDEVFLKGNYKFVAESYNSHSPSIEQILSTIKIFDLNDPDVRDSIRIKRLNELLMFAFPRYYESNLYKKVDSGWSNDFSIGQYPKTIKEINLKIKEFSKIETIQDPLDNKDISYTPHIGKDYIDGFRIGVSLENKDNPFLRLDGCDFSQNLCPDENLYEKVSYFNGDDTKGCNGESGRFCFDIVCRTVNFEKGRYSYTCSSGKGDRSIFYIADWELYLRSPEYIKNINTNSASSTKEKAGQITEDKNQDTLSNVSPETKKIIDKINETTVNATIKANLDVMRAQAEILYDQNVKDRYKSLCSNGYAINIIDSAKKVSGITKPTNIDINTSGSVGTATCHVSSDNNSWAVEVPLKSPPTSFQCIDSKTVVVTTSSTLGVGDTKCGL